MLRAVIVLVLMGVVGAAGAEFDEPVFHVDAASPTQDKPQSKLWYAEGCWWAWLPDADGSSVWRRSAAGWKREHPLDGDLHGLPGRADVWADADGVWAVLVGRDECAVVRLVFSSERGGYGVCGAPVRWSLPPGGDRPKSIESATIGRDSTGRVWVAYDHNCRIWVRSWSGYESDAWSDAEPLGSAGMDDLCCLVVLPGGVGVIWSDQDHDAVFFRERVDGSSLRQWQTAVTVQRGDRTADDHLNAAVARDGTLFVATKNSVDEVNREQLILRIRTPDGRWCNRPYAIRSTVGEPSRPIAALSGLHGGLLLAHTVYMRGERRGEPSIIAGMVVDPDAPLLEKEPAVLMRASSPLNDVTSCKAIGSEDGAVPWIVIASDQSGNIYEAVVAVDPIGACTVQGAGDGGGRSAGSEHPAHPSRERRQFEPQLHRP